MKGEYDIDDIGCGGGEHGDDDELDWIGLKLVPYFSTGGEPTAVGCPAALTLEASLL